MVSVSSAPDVSQRIRQRLDHLDAATDRYERTPGHDDATVRYARRVSAALRELVQRQIPPARIHSVPVAVPSRQVVSSEDNPKRRLIALLRVHGTRSMWGALMQQAVGGREGLERILGREQLRRILQEPEPGTVTHSPPQPDTVRAHKEATPKIAA